MRTPALVQARIGHLQLSTNPSQFLKLTFVILFEILRLRSVKDVNKRRKLFASFPTFRFQMWFLFCFVIVCFLTSQKNEASSLHVVAVVVVNLSVRSSWWYYMSFFLLGLVTGVSKINWESSHTLSKKEKRNRSLSQRKRRQFKLKCEKSLKFCFCAVTFKKPHLFYYISPF